jgi:hypothetical protein
MASRPPAEAPIATMYVSRIFLGFEGGLLPEVFVFAIIKKL